MDYAFKTGDVCEIITRKNGEPKRDWLEFAKTANARSHIKRFLRGKGIDLWAKKNSLLLHNRYYVTAATQKCATAIIIVMRVEKV